MHDILCKYCYYFFTKARLFTIPIGGVAVNTLDLDQVVTKLNSHLSVHKVSTL